MIKLIGSVLILTGFGVVWISELCRWRKEAETLSDLFAALGEMSDRIRLTRMPLPRLFRELGRAKHGPVCEWLTEMANHLEAGQPVQSTWISACNNLPVEEGVHTKIAELGYKFTGDEECICNTILVINEFLKNKLEEKQRQKRDRERQATALCFSGAALLIILLL